MTDAGNSTMSSLSKDNNAWIAIYSEACLSQKNPDTVAGC